MYAYSLIFIPPENLSNDNKNSVKYFICRSTLADFIYKEMCTDVSPIIIIYYVLSGLTLDYLKKKKKKKRARKKANKKTQPNKQKKNKTPNTSSIPFSYKTTFKHLKCVEYSLNPEIIN